MRSVTTILLATLVAAAIPAQEEPFLGISIQNGHSALRRGVVVTRVLAGTGAARAGLRPGDIILLFDDAEPTTAEALIEAIKARKIGDEVLVHVRRAGTELDLEIALTGRPEGDLSGPSVVLPDPLGVDQIEAQFRRAERAYLTRDFDRLALESATLEAQVSFHISTGLEGLDEAARETVEAEIRGHRRRIAWYSTLAADGIHAPINIYAGTIASGTSLEDRIAALVGQLADEDFERREDATRALRAIGEPARGQLEAALESDDMEVRWRAQLVLDQLTEQTLPGKRPAADYRPVSISVTEFLDGRIEFVVESGDTLQSPGPLFVAHLRDGQQMATFWIKDVEPGRAHFHRQSSDDEVPDLLAGDRLLWIFKIQPE